ncbi:MAG TPA: PKD-like domain-containing protein, partial [Mucilaginibacter sp.]|nr:PKD-like domain-containing protein [Mucilaginibacter sp.]
MDKTFTKHLFFLAILLLTITGAFAQTITVGTVDPGPYAPGSTVAVPISLGTTGSCLDKTANQFQVILSNSSGSFASGTTVLGTYSGFYASFVNGTLPSTLAPGTYNIEVVTTTPASTSSNTASITVAAGTAVKPTISTETVAPGVYGRCVGTLSPYTFTPTSSGTVTASFYNETSGSSEGTNITIPAGGYSFTPTKSYYTVIAKSTSGGVVGTYGYQLINNNLLNPFSPVGQPFACMPSGGMATLTFGVPFSGAIGINNNYPGTLYTVSWGDGTTSVLDYCDIVQAGGLLSHDYTAPTCGSGTPLQVICQPSTPYCGSLTAPSTTTAKIIITPTVDFGLPAIACVGTAITVPNNSRPGPDYSTATQTDCNLQNPNALYDWYFDGTLVASQVNLSYSYVIPATTPHGTHTILLHADAPADPNTPYCAAADVQKSICLENPPQPAFTIPSPVCIASMPVSVNNASIVDSAPCSPPVYTWSATPSTYTFAGGTDQNSVSPKFNFTAAGTYTVTLNIGDAANTPCSSKSVTQMIVVQTTPVATLSPDVSLCGDNQTLTFDGTSGSSTKVTFTGAASTDTYAWTVVPPAGGSAVFTGATNSSSKFPQIVFVGYGTYTINVTHTNACGSSSDSQNITFVQPPTVDAGTDQTVCAYPVPTVTLSGSVVGGTGYSWSSAGGGTFSSTTTLNPTYTPSASEISAGIATLTLTATSTAPCVTTTDQVIINITPQAQINSSATVATCSGQAINYNITADHSGTSFTWTAGVTTGTASGVTASGSGNNIADLLINTGVIDAIVTYTISPTYNSCPGVP